MDHSPCDQSGMPMPFRCLVLVYALLAGCTGGQTGDFGSMESCGDPVPVPDEVAEEFGLSEALALQGEFETSLGWRDLSTAQNGPPFATKSETRLHVRLTLGTPGLLGTAPDGGVLGGSSCRRVTIPLQAEVETDDGTIQGSLTGELYRSRDMRWRAAAWHPGSGPGLETVLGFSLYPDGPRGDLQIGAPEAHGTFPVDECGDEGTPIQLSTPQPWLGSQSVEQWVERFNAAFALDGGVPASWRDGSSTQVTLELAARGTDIVCGGPPVLWLPVSGRLRSADGRVDIELERAELRYASGSASLSAGDSMSYVSATLRSDSLPVQTLTGHAAISSLDGTETGCLFWPPILPSDQKCIDLLRAME